MIRRLMRNYIAKERWQEENGQVYETVTLMYDYHSPWKLTSLQHHHGENIFCTTHVHVDHSACLEGIFLKRETSRVKTFVQELEKTKGLKSVDTVITSGM